MIAIRTTAHKEDSLKPGPQWLEPCQNDIVPCTTGAVEEVEVEAEEGQARPR